MGSDDITAHFDLDSNGNIMVFPLIDFKSALVGGMLCLVRLECEQQNAPPCALQVQMTATQADEVAQALLRLAKFARQGGTSETQ